MFGAGSSSCQDRIQIFWADRRAERSIIAVLQYSFEEHDPVFPQGHRDIHDRDDGEHPQHKAYREEAKELRPG